MAYATSDVAKRLKGRPNTNAVTPSRMRIASDQHGSEKAERGSWELGIEARTISLRRRRSLAIWARGQYHVISAQFNRRGDDVFVVRDWREHPVVVQERAKENNARSRYTCARLEARTTHPVWRAIGRERFVGCPESPESVDEAAALSSYARLRRGEEIVVEYGTLSVSLHSPQIGKTNWSDPKWWLNISRTIDQLWAADRAPDCVFSLRMGGSGELQSTSSGIGEECLSQVDVRTWWWFSEGDCCAQTISHIGDKGS
ncbi:hypothetical protein FA13DRAFT_1781835 [Coprinellus micaceus]|uniref:Uncharacterized protein n=1 Tax=Coprinellus micaceus TaxID=71717 RepID=A0A4Y7S891_COPMI|nr:hypothetical protein FA13DRAFT_1781835 [Coprinellus micaceus]